MAEPIMVKWESDENQMPNLRKAADAPAERELTEALRRVYKRYGGDLNSFFRHVREQAGPASGKSEASSPRSHRDDESAA